jgi:hypothetical protein
MMTKQGFKRPSKVNYAYFRLRQQYQKRRRPDLVYTGGEFRRLTSGAHSPAQKLQIVVDHAGDSTSVKPSLAALLRKLAISRSRARCS